MRDGRGNLVPMLFAVFLGLLGVAWQLGTPPGAGPDEPAHYVKAIGAGGGDLAGRDAAPSQAEIRALINARRSPEQRRLLEALLEVKLTERALWHRRASREFTVPAGLSYSAFGCGYLRNDWRCLERGSTTLTPTEQSTYVGTYQPYVYVLPGLAMRAADRPTLALRLGRLANAAVSLGLLALAALVLWERSAGAVALAGLVVAVTPIVVFFASILNPSGPELSSAVCFVASLLRLTRAPHQPSWVWALAAASGSVLALSRSLGPVFVVLMVGAIVVLDGWQRARAAVRAAPKTALAAAATLALACLAGTIWERVYQPHVSSAPDAVLDGLDEAIDMLPSLPRQAVGVFGGIDIYLPLGFYVIWWLMLVALLAVAFYAARTRDRVLLTGLAIAIVVGTLLLSSVFSQTGLGLQARYVLPLAVLLPLWAGELLSRNREQLDRHTLTALIVAVTAGAAVVHAAAWFRNAGELSDAHWDPPLGWPALAAIVLTALAAFLAAGWRAARAA
jgi:Predicted membrane protein (DUF2142)